MEWDVAGLVNLAGDRDGVVDQIKVLLADRCDLADPQAGVGAEQDLRPGAAVHPDVQQTTKCSSATGRGSAVVTSFTLGAFAGRQGPPGPVRDDATHSPTSSETSPVDDLPVIHSTTTADGCSVRQRGLQLRPLRIGQIVTGMHQTCLSGPAAQDPQDTP